MSGKGAVRINFLSTVGELGVSHPAWMSQELNKWFENEPLEDNIGWVIFDYGNASLAEKVYSLNFNN